METRKPELDLKGSCVVGGRPDALLLSPDASQLYVFDQELPLVTVIATARWQLVDRFMLGPSSSPNPVLLGGLEDSIFIGGRAGKVEVVDASTRSSAGFFLCKGDACDLGFLP